jgi:hypothetical protein
VKSRGTGGYRPIAHGRRRLSDEERNGRWSYIHANFPNHRAAALEVLGVPEKDREAVRRAVASWDALELEEAIIAAKGAGGIVRSMAEWAQHPRAAAIATRR